MPSTNSFQATFSLKQKFIYWKPTSALKRIAAVASKKTKVSLGSIPVGLGGAIRWSEQLDSATFNKKCSHICSHDANLNCTSSARAGLGACSLDSASIPASFDALIAAAAQGKHIGAAENQNHPTLISIRNFKFCLLFDPMARIVHRSDF